jgi:hypothetical protein
MSSQSCSPFRFFRSHSANTNTPRPRLDQMASVIPFLLLAAVTFSTSGCKELGLSANCCCYPTLSTSKNDGKIVDPSQCHNVDYYCAGNSIENSVDERNAYAQHCGKKASLIKPDDPFAFTLVGSYQPELCLRGTVVSQPRNELFPRPNSDQQDPSQCDTQCAEDGPFCLKVNLEDQNSMLSKVEQARHLIMNKQDDQIPTSKFMNIFGVETDPCDRKDTLLSAAKLSNNGQPCYLNSSITDGTDSFKFIVRLPKTIEGTRTVEGQKVTLSFSNPMKSPVLTIGDTTLNKDFGGRLLRATADGAMGIVSTERGCIAVQTHSSRE